MSVVSTSIPNLVNGISQQNPTQRNITQAEAQVNAQIHNRCSENRPYR